MAKAKIKTSSMQRNFTFKPAGKIVFERNTSYDYEVWMSDYPQYWEITGLKKTEVVEKIEVVDETEVVAEVVEKTETSTFKGTEFSAVHKGMGRWIVENELGEKVQPTEDGEFLKKSEAKELAKQL